MHKLRFFDLIGKRVLVSRGSTWGIESRFYDALLEGDGHLIIDLDGIEGITPSFLDEALSIIEEAVSKLGVKELDVTIIGPPTTLSSKFKAVGRGRGLLITETEDGGWKLSRV